MDLRDVFLGRQEIVKCNYFEDRDLVEFTQLMTSFEDGIRDNVGARFAILYELSKCKNGNINYGFVIWLNEGIAIC